MSQPANGVDTTNSPSTACCDTVLLSACCGREAEPDCCGPEKVPAVCGCGNGSANATRGSSSTAAVE